MTQQGQQQWMQWEELPWLSNANQTGSVLQLADQLLQGAGDAYDCSALLQSRLPEIAAEFSVQWVAYIQRVPDENNLPVWKTISECGRNPFSSVPFDIFEEVLDRDSGIHTEFTDPIGWSMIALPLHGADAGLFVLAGRNLSVEMLPFGLVTSRVLEHCLKLVESRTVQFYRIERLKTILEIASEFAQMRETEPLLELIAKESTRLLACDRASIFIWDRDNKEVIACPALGVDEGTLRLADNIGVVGDVLKSGTSCRIDNAYNDPRFDKDVDQTTGYKTKNLLCQPLKDSNGKLIGAFEVLNKNEGIFTADDEESLTQLGVQAAIAIENTREREQLIRSREHLTKQVTQGVNIIGESPAICALRDTIVRLASTDLPVLILGESGTGKEVVAQSLHYQGARADNPFVAINCAALTETLLESELFGHEKGSFTDAHDTRPGKFELAEGGTLFLDEIGDMSLGGQAKLLRVLEQKVITRVGGSQTIPTNVRIVAATNAKLVENVREKKFREDLYFRLNVVTQNLPPLRERPEDILLLAEHFLKQFCIQARRKMLPISAEARRRLQAHAWPGNIRELRNLMERIAFLAQGDKVEAEDLAFILSPETNPDGDGPLDCGLGEATKQFQQGYIRKCVKRVRGNMSEAARLLGLHRSNLYRKMRQLEMNEGFDEK
ncbi:two-component signal transduction [hydrothermal vent metagenome]|uniref:Two-component signal transduction n=1 Tax=hydrothermal vent metagenome TaxID=652676 RepID=A0A3B1DRH3_9ZZZZ